MTTSDENTVPESVGAGVEGKEAAGSRTESVEERRRKWLEENREAIEDYNRWFEEQGLILEKYHLF